MSNGDAFSIGQTLDHFAHRLLTDCLNEATRTYWLKRAEDFERAKPRPGEHAGRATREELRAQWRRLDEMARACRARAQVSHLDQIRDEVAAALEEVA